MVRWRWLTRALVVGALLATSACSSAAPDDVSASPEVSSPASSAPPAPQFEGVDLDGEWMLTATIVESNVPEIYELGFAEVHYPRFTAVTCAESECSGAIVLRSDPERELANDLAGEYLQTAESLGLTFSDSMDCYFNKSVAVDGLDTSRSFELVVEDPGDPSSARLVGTSTFDYSPTPAAVAAGCDPTPAHVIYAVTLDRR